MTTTDDGSLSFLKIKPNEQSKHFNGKEVTQQSLINTSFWICDYVKDVKTKYGEGRYLVKAKNEGIQHQAMASWMGWLQYCNSGSLKVKLNKRLGNEIIRKTKHSKVQPQHMAGTLQ